MKLKLSQRHVYLLLFITSLIMGLLSRSDALQLTGFIREYSGDTIWAFMVFWFICFLFPSKKISSKFWLAIAFSFFIEFSQMYHAPWIESVRSVKVFALVLGYGFKYTDLLCYTAGISFGTVIELLRLKK